MPNGDLRDGFFYPTLTLMIDSFSLSLQMYNTVYWSMWPVIVAFSKHTHLEDNRIQHFQLGRYIVCYLFFQCKPLMNI